MLNFNKTMVNDPFFNKIIKNITDNVIPYQWDVLNDKIEGFESYAVNNFRIAAGEAEGEFKGFIFQDSDLAKWVEAASFSLLYNDSEEVRRNLNEIISLMAKAQLEDGYLDTYFILKEPEQKWKQLTQGHELYVTGHFLEAAAAHYMVTGETSLLNIMAKNVDLICTIFGREEGRLHSYPGHEEIELALLKIYNLTKEEKYLNLAEYFIESRGEEPGFCEEENFKKFNKGSKYFDKTYYQVHDKIRNQKDAEGHSVRAMYFFTGAADLAREKNDESLISSLNELWDNTTGKRMYITGGLGSHPECERFSVDYDLPNDTCYTETCAAIGLAMWAQRMLKIEPNVKFSDVMERAIYNNVLSGISYDGKKYFYVNPLFVKPDVAKYRSDHSAIALERVSWFGCACCPPNVSRTMTGLGGYMFTETNNTVYQHLFIGNNTEFSTDTGALSIKCTSEMPWNGKMTIECSGEGKLKYALRIPSYAKNFVLTLNGVEADYEVVNGYAVLKSPLKEHDMLEVSFEMQSSFVLSNPKVAENCNKVAVLRGPIVYCAEEADNGKELNNFKVNVSKKITSETSEDFGGIVTLTVKGEALDLQEWGSTELYSICSEKQVIDREMKLIPYFLWNNRGVGEMLVWMNR